MILTSPTELSYIPKRIISLVPSQTELLHHLGLEDEAIAITKFCVHPETWFRTKTRIGGTKALNIEKIMELQPDFIIANNEENVKDQVEALASTFPVWVTDVADLESAIKMIGDVGLLTGKILEAENLASGTRSRFALLAEFILSQEKPPVRTAYFIWKDPYMTIGGDTFINDMMKRSGLLNIFESAKRYPEVSIQQLKKMNCQLLLLSSEPYPFTEKHIHLLEAEFPDAKVLLVDGEMFSWYGSRLLQSPGYFKELLSEVFAVQK